MLPVLNIGPLAIQLPGLFLIGGVWVGSIMAERAAERHDVPPDAITNLIFYSLLAGLIGARLGYALQFLSIYLERPLGLFSLNPSTLSLPEGMLAGGLLALIYGQRRRLRLWSALDALAPGLAAFSIALGFSHLASGDFFGMQTTLPWRISLFGAERHPTQVYEILLAGLTLMAVLWASRQRSIPGFTFLLWMALASGSYLLISGFRGDSVVIFGMVRQGQLVSLALLLLAMVAVHFRARAEISAEKG
ncbi:MAG: prolipoprotein diacylglyceryl transferase [Anaerolineales bacterium]